MAPVPIHDSRNSQSHADQCEPVKVAKTTRKQIARPATVGNRVILSYLIPFVLYHAALPLALVPWLFSWSGLLLIPILHFVFDWVGVGLCFHRTLTHGGLVLPKWLERTFVVFGLCNLMDSPARWVAIHRKHHQHTDEQPDPHTPLVTFWWGHMGWLIRENEETSQVTFYHRYAPDILRDPFYLNIERYRLWAVIYLVHAGLLVAVGFVTGWLWDGTYQAGIQLALSWLLWGVILRTLFSWHATFAVNSVTHIWGYRNYETGDSSTNHWLVALLTGGEGWHNNHHAHPVSAAHGHEWWEFDPTYLNICLLKRLGLATDVKTYRKNSDD
jgi:fatty-acid desaturase